MPIATGHDLEDLAAEVQSISPGQARRFTKFRERKCLIDKNVVRTDRSLSFNDGDDNPNVKLLNDILLTYSFHNFDLGYYQGMSDLLSPILFSLRDESETFRCFVKLMERLGPNFNRDQNGMHSQLFAITKVNDRAYECIEELIRSLVIANEIDEGANQGECDARVV